MAHSVEGRFPFLDYRVVEFAGTIPARMRMRGLDEKHILRRAVRDLLPAEIWLRPKQPYRAPMSAAFCGPEAPEYVAGLLAPERVTEAGFFNPVAVSRLLAKCRSSAHVGENDEMALVGVLSTQLWYDAFVKHFDVGTPDQRTDVVTVAAGAPLVTV
jgi:asparagine synthase (glutamine-hydrolysing)